MLVFYFLLSILYISRIAVVTTLTVIKLAERPASYRERKIRVIKCGNAV